MLTTFLTLQSLSQSGSAKLMLYHLQSEEILLEMVFLLLLLKPFLAVIRAEYVTLVRKIHLPDAGQHLGHTA